MLYCLVPFDLAAKLHEPLRRHFREEPHVEVIVERRRAERRGPERRCDTTTGPPGPRERRAVREPAGRRVEDRRAVGVTHAAPMLPRRARPYADRLVFFERLEPQPVHLEDVDTQRLVRRLQAGDQDAFAELYIRYFDRVYSYLRVAFDQIHDAEDATQQVFAKVFEAFPRYQASRAPFRAWLFTIVRNHTLTELAKQGRVEPVDTAELDRRGERNGDDDLDLSALEWVSDKDLTLLIERLPLPQRQVLFLRFMLDLPHAQVAKVLGRSSDDVRNLQSRGLRFLRARLTALGRAPTRQRSRLVRARRQAPVLRMRRFALRP